MSATVRPSLRRLVLELRERIEHEDWFGHCSNREDAEALEREHNELLARIDAEIAHYRWKDHP